MSQDLALALGILEIPGIRPRLCRRRYCHHTRTGIYLFERQHDGIRIGKQGFAVTRVAERSATLQRLKSLTLACDGRPDGKGLCHRSAQTPNP